MRDDLIFGKFKDADSMSSGKRNAGRSARTEGQNSGVSVVHCPERERGIGYKHIAWFKFRPVNKLFRQSLNRQFKVFRHIEVQKENSLNIFFRAGSARMDNH